MWSCCAFLVTRFLMWGCCRCSSGEGGQILHVPQDATGTGPLLLITHSTFRQQDCDETRPLFLQLGAAQFVLRNMTFTPLAGCNTSALASTSSFVNVDMKGCNEVQTQPDACVHPHALSH